MLPKGTGNIIDGPSKGSMCHFPFEYNGKKHYQCITDDSPRQIPWCSSLPIFSPNSYGNCDCSIEGKQQ